MAKKDSRESRILDFSIGLLLLLIAAFAVSATLRVGPKPAGTPKHPIRIELLNGSGREYRRTLVAAISRVGSRSLPMSIIVSSTAQ